MMSNRTVSIVDEPTGTGSRSIFASPTHWAFCLWEGDL